MVRLNGNEQVFEKITVAKLLTQKGYRVETVAVEINESIVPKADYAKVQIKDNDTIEVISFVGGG